VVLGGFDDAGCELAERFSSSASIDEFFSHPRWPLPAATATGLPRAFLPVHRPRARRLPQLFVAPLGAYGHAAADDLALRWCHDTCRLDVEDRLRRRREQRGSGSITSIEISKRAVFRAFVPKPLQNPSEGGTPPSLPRDRSTITAATCPSITGAARRRDRFNGTLTSAPSLPRHAGESGDVERAPPLPAFTGANERGARMPPSTL